MENFLQHVGSCLVVDGDFVWFTGLSKCRVEGFPKLGVPCWGFPRVEGLGFRDFGTLGSF